MAQMVKNLPAMQEMLTDKDSTPGSTWFPGGGPGNPLQYSCLENLMDRGVWWQRVHRVAKELDTTEVDEQEQCAFRIQLFGKRTLALVFILYASVS